MSPEARVRFEAMKKKLATDKASSHDSWPEPDVLFLVGIINEMERKA